jgi:hypothetical protein
MESPLMNPSVYQKSRRILSEVDKTEMMFDERTLTIQAVLKHQSRRYLNFLVISKLATLFGHVSRVPTSEEEIDVF